jgi:hypothetical protein
MTVELRYVGPFDQVRVPLPTGGELHVEHGDVATFPTTWRPVCSTSRRTGRRCSTPTTRRSTS